MDQISHEGRIIMADQHSMWRTRTTFRSELDMAIEELGAIYEQQKEVF